MKTILLSIALTITCTCFSQKILIFGGEDHDVFLGYFNTGTLDTKSIWNEFGTYGNCFNSKCIWNEFGPYGSTVSQYSPFNKYALYPPVLVDLEGNFYGYLTANENNPKQSRLRAALFVVKNVDLIRKDVGKFYDLIFN